ncbi:stage III sporulation protein AA [Aceticella autotrophica]|uniref:Stage III sporulation protein AA n=1 Tax=Aceticella autotrophica TaxID=2755338 RepID=A0A974Y457_9THEO|nr:stage III sporulation protein AA [Aceticella autotrophica]QSZ26517.1 stage III sporulation protein AA [Aceticella autotrophica]
MKNESKNYIELLNSLPCNVRNIVKRLSKNVVQKMEEIRLRVNNPLMIHMDNEEKFVSSSGEIADMFEDSYIVTQEDCEKAIQLISKSSIYAFEEEIKNGFITLKGGYRVGICGKCVLEKGEIKTIKNISGYNYRIMRELIGISDEIMKYILFSPDIVYNTLIISPPQCGKTTLLRDIARNISNGIPQMNYKGHNIAIVDERSEIAACYNGIPQNDVGYRTDVLDCCPKDTGIIMLIRSMSPDVLITDEIGKIEDIKAIHEALNAGVKIITTIHGYNINDIMRKEYIKELITEKEFNRYIVLSNRFGAGTIETILDDNLKVIFKGPYRGKVSK